MSIKKIGIKYLFAIFEDKVSDWLDDLNNEDLDLLHSACAVLTKELEQEMENRLMPIE